MHALTLLHTQLKKSLPEIHKSRLNSLANGVKCILLGAHLTLTSLGRHKQGNAKVKNKIKSIDYLLGNSHIHAENFSIQKSIAQIIIGEVKFLRIIIDWSSCPDDTQHLLKASLVCKGRSMTLYEKIYPKQKQGTYDAHEEFLYTLSEIIPKNKKVLIITDAGFRTDFFELVLLNGWDFEGRVRTDMLYLEDSGENWKPTKSLYSRATSIPKYIGKVQLTKKNQLECHLYLYKEVQLDTNKKKKKNRKRRHGKMDKEYRKRYTDPWLLATSLPHEGRSSAKEVVKNYKKRMKIEHEFRDMKDHKWGLGLKLTRTKSIRRLETLLLIGMLALFIFWLIGLAAEAKNLHYDYQVNTCHIHRVLSLTFLGMQIIFHDPEKISVNELKLVLKEASEHV